MVTVDNNQSFFLALQRRPGDSIFIDISKLSIAEGYIPHSLMEIDSFTIHFTVDEIKKSIKEANIAEAEYEEGSLVIQDSGKHKPLKVLDKSYVDEFNLDIFLKEHLGNKELMNNISYKFGNIVQNEQISEQFKVGVKTNNIEILLNIIFNIDYLLQRKFMIYLINIYHNKKDKKDIKQELKRDKAA